MVCSTGPFSPPWTHKFHNHPCCHSLSVWIPLHCPTLAASNPFKLPYHLPSFLHLASAFCFLTLKLSFLLSFGNPEQIMFEKRDEFLWPQAELREESSRKWPWLKAVVGLISTLVILSASVVLAGVHPANIRTAEFVLEASKWMQSISSSSFCPCLYVILNILILILGVKSTSAASKASSSASPSPSPSTISSHYYPCQCSQLYHKPESTYEIRNSPSSETLMVTKPEWKAEETQSLTVNGEQMLETLMVMKPEWKAEETQSLTVNGEQMLESLPKHKASDKVKAAETPKAPVKAPALVLPRSCSLRELHCKKVNKPSNLSRESSHTQPLQKYKCGDVAPVGVTFEICCGEGGGDTDGHGDKEKDGNLSCEELKAKAESFIGNFYRELKMQREDSWKRLCAIYRKSC